MGYEGHLMMVADRSERAERVETSMALLLAAADDVGGDIVSGGGTGTFDTNTWCTEIQAGSYTLLDTDYAKLDLPFEIALNVLGTVISVSSKGWMIADTGLKSMGMDHGNPTWEGGDLFFLSDEHATLLPPEHHRLVGRGSCSPPAGARRPDRSRSTSISGSSTATTSSIVGTSTCATGESSQVTRRPQTSGGGETDRELLHREQHEARLVDRAVEGPCQLDARRALAATA